MLVTKQMLIAIDFHSMEKNTMDVSVHKHFSKYILFLREERIYRGLDNPRVSKWQFSFLGELSH